jgi:hypothetical protein
LPGRTEENHKILKQAKIQIRDLPKVLQRPHLEKRSLDGGIILKCILVVNISQLWSFNLSVANLQNIVVDTYDVLALTIWCITFAISAPVSVGMVGKEDWGKIVCPKIYIMHGLGEVKLVL